MSHLHLHPTARRTLTDDELVDAVRRGAAGAIEEIHARYAPALLVHARGLLGGDHHEAEECVQDAFVRALRGMRRDPDRDLALRAWLHAIVRNACLDRLRARAVRPTTRLDDVDGWLRHAGGDPVEALQRRDELARVVGAVGALPARQRRALVIHGLDGRSHAETAATLGVGEGASKALVHRARRELRASLAA